jgi:hypothetical protein
VKTGVDAWTDADLRARIERFLAFPTPQEPVPCAMCRGAARYPDHRCALHTGYLRALWTKDRIELDRGPATHLAVWREFFRRVALCL